MFLNSSSLSSSVYGLSACSNSWESITSSVSDTSSPGIASGRCPRLKQVMIKSMTYVRETPKSTLKLLENFDTVLTCLFSNSIFQNRSKVFSPFAFRLSEDLKSVKESLSFSICNCSLFQFIKLIMSSFDNSISSSALLRTTNYHLKPFISTTEEFRR